MKIPKHVVVGLSPYKVTPVKSIDKCRGEVNYKEREIKIARRNDHLAYTYSKEELANTFWHELTHAILHDMGSKLAYDEKFVTKFSDRLDQAIKTATRVERWCRVSWLMR